MFSIADKPCGRIGNFINAEAYGVETNLPWRMGIYEGNKYVEVHPTFLYEMLVTITISIILTIRKDKRKFKGENTYIYLILYGLGRMIIEGLRADSLMLGSIRISQMLSVILFGVFLTKYVMQKRATKFV